MARPIGFREGVQAVLDARDMTRADLAKRMGVSAARVTQALAPDANPTIATMAAISSALDLEVHVLLLRRRGSCLLGSWDPSPAREPALGLAA